MPADKRKALADWSLGVLGTNRHWRWKSRSLGGRPKIGGDLRALIRQMSVDFWYREGRASMGELLPMAGQQAHHGQPSLRPNSLLQACNTPRRTSGSVKAHHPRSADQSAISKPTVTLTRNVSSPVAAMSLRRLLALTLPSAPMLPVPHRTGRSKSSVFRDPFNSPKLQARSLRIDLRLAPHIGDCGLAGLVQRF